MYIVFKEVQKCVCQITETFKVQCPEYFFFSFSTHNVVTQFSLKSKCHVTRSGGDCYGEVTGIRWLHEKLIEGGWTLQDFKHFLSPHIVSNLISLLKLDFFKNMQWPGSIPPKHIDAKQDLKLETIQFERSNLFIAIVTVKGPL